MKKVIFFLFATSVFFACSKDSDDDFVKEKDDKIWVEAYYTTKENRDRERVDFQSPVFVYYNIDASEFFKYTYLEDGVFAYNTDTIKPMYSDSIDISGCVIIEPELTDKIVTVGVASNYYKGRISLNSFDMKYVERKSIKLINNP